MGVGLVPRAAEGAHAGGQLGGHVDHDLVGVDELAGQQSAEPVGVLDRPGPLGPPPGELQQPPQLGRVGVDAQLIEDLVVLVERDRGVGPLVGVDPDDDRHEGVLSP